MYKTTDKSVSIADWIKLNMDSIPSDLIVKSLGGEAFEHIEWINRYHDYAVHEKEDRQLYGGLVPAQTAVYVFSESGDDRPNVRKALDDSGFELFEVGGDCPVEFFFGIDGGGYSFVGQHWIPLRARLAAYMMLSDMYEGTQTVALRALLYQWDMDMRSQGETLQGRCPEVYERLEAVEAQTEAACTRMDDAELDFVQTYIEAMDRTSLEYFVHQSLCALYRPDGEDWNSEVEFNGGDVCEALDNLVPKDIMAWLDGRSRLNNAG